VFHRKPEPKSFDSHAAEKRAQPFGFNGGDSTSGMQHAADPAMAAGSDTSAAISVPSEPLLVESVIGRDLSIEGQSIAIRCKGLLRVNGSIQADLHGKKLVVGDEATITGAITAEAVDVYGKVFGTIEATSVMLRATADVEGDITSRTLSIEPGASFDGRARKVKDGDDESGTREPLPKPVATLHS
jgi:cytoskeletal protein CcmA (bactofilin family)